MQGWEIFWMDSKLFFIISFVGFFNIDISAAFPSTQPADGKKLWLIRCVSVECVVTKLADTSIKTTPNAVQKWMAPPNTCPHAGWLVCWH